MAYRTFKRTWWKDRACTIPGAGRKSYTGHYFETQQQAREFCQRSNLDDFGPSRRGVRGMAYEFEES